MTTDRGFCRSLGHLPRQINAHPTNRNLTVETCLRCGVRVERSRWTGEEWEIHFGERLQFLGVGVR